MDKYYYLVSQLPFLRFNEKTYITRDYLLGEAKKWLNPSDFLIFSGVDINSFSDSYGDPKVLRDYKKFERNMRNEILLLRKGLRANGEHKVSDVLQEIVNQGNPLEIEKKLLYLRWRFIEELESGHYFDLDFIILYSLKVQILRRLFVFDKEKGIKKFEAACRVSYE